ncbi:zinc finger CCCH domain-containing protein 14 [Ixodes scapularis]|uniref:zinc finger CCCH domain-containing protein 14 n=1 Tax=Ixodes scapularis TaxID=6945 RepID=UPI001C393B9C|nr:zinc finger CCCH domain-containing protein 14 [Ixodes scapularis]
MDGNEVTQKIRVAIKTKLVELGAYVDDELPDYIMVMIANKKTKEQMARDLSLFLGDSTTNFTNWLQGILDHLQAIASEAKRSKGEVRTEGPVPPPHLEYTPREVLPRGKVPELRGDGEYSDEVLALKADPEPDDDLGEDLHGSAETPPEKQVASSSVSLVRPIPRVMGPEPARAHVFPSKADPSKKPALTSSSGVRRRPQFISDDEEEEEEEYDPSNPSVSSVASVVKVSERRSSVPQSMQANKLLLLKAMKAAHQSVSAPAATRTRRNPSARVEPYQPTPIRELSTKRRRLGNLAQKEEEEEEAVPAKRSTGLSIKDRLGQRVAVALPENTSPTMEPERVPGKASRLVGAIAPEVRPREESAPVALPEPEATTANAIDEEPEQEEDSDLLELEVPREEVHLVVKDATPTSTPGHASASEDVLGRGGKWPHFVVTLNGVDPASFKSGTREVVAHHASGPGDLDELPEYVEEEDENGYPSRREDSMAAEDTVLEEELEEEPMLVEEGPSKLLEKCRYWPACKNGDRCPYHHPSVPCKAFPNCKFRDKCLFIHPNCKYDAFCKHKSCPFTHASRRTFACPPPPTSSPSVQHCKFYPHCTNTKCPFFHPKPCRFGAMCQAPACPYTHPESSIPPPNKLKWTSAAAKKAGETAA